MDYQTLVSAEVLNQQLDNPDWVVFDTRFNLADPSAGAQAYEAGHIPGAHYVHLDDQLSSAITPTTGRHPLPDIQQFADWLLDVGVSHDTQVVVYDAMGGAMASRCWWLLKTLGHNKVAVLDGGLPRWQQLDYPMATEIPAVRSSSEQPSALAAQWDKGQVVDADTVLANIESRQFLLVDARNGERFRGEEEPIDPVAGHVPGAVNRSLFSNLDADGRFKSPEQLRQEWSACLEGYTPDQVVHMCGSGVTACHNRLAMDVAGLAGSRVYPGSWSEWIRDPQHPVATE